MSGDTLSVTTLYRIILGVALVLSLQAAPPVYGQTDGLLHLNDETHRFLQSQKTLGHLPDAFLSHQPLSVYEAGRYLDSLARRDSVQQLLSPADRTTLARLRGHTARPGAAWAQRIFSVYENGGDLLTTDGERYALQINPQYYGHLGLAHHRQASRRFANTVPWRNTRGVRLSGRLGEHLYVESRLTENQWRPVWPAFAENTAPRTPHISFYDSGDPYNYFNAVGVLGLKTRHIELRAGRDQNHWGGGQGSVVLSDYAPVYDQLQFRATLGPIQYNYLLARFLDARTQDAGPSGPFRASRYAALHRLEWRVTDRVDLGFFEGIVLGPDTLGVQRSRAGFDPAYLNPVTAFRPVERDLGSPDNALLGVEGGWTLYPGIRVYGQFVLDELRISEIGNQWWGNKWGWMLGAHVVDPGIPHLDTRVEVTRLRPYLYSHVTRATAFTHMGDGLGHPAGPNSLDVSFFVDVDPPGRWRTHLQAAWTVRGRNRTTEDGEVTENVGADATVSNASRTDSYGIAHLQGIRHRQGLLEVAVEAEVLPHLHVSTAVRGERVDDAQWGTDYYLSPRILLRWGMPFQSLRY